MVAIKYTNLDMQEFSTIALNFTCPKLKSPININLPWPQWVEKNSKNGRLRPKAVTKD